MVHSNTLSRYFSGRAPHTAGHTRHSQTDPHTYLGPPRSSRGCGGTRTGSGSWCAGGPPASPVDRSVCVSECVWVCGCGCFLIWMVGPVAPVPLSRMREEWTDPCTNLKTIMPRTYLLCQVVAREITRRVPQAVELQVCARGVQVCVCVCVCSAPASLYRSVCAHTGAHGQGRPARVTKPQSITVETTLCVCALAQVAQRSALQGVNIVTKRPRDKDTETDLIPQNALCPGRDGDDRGLDRQLNVRHCRIIPSNLAAGCVCVCVCVCVRGIG